MTNEEVQKLIQGIYDSIFNSVTQAEPGGKPVLPSSTTMLSLMKPGMAIRAADFRNPWTPGNSAGSQDAAVHTAQLADVAPTMSSLYSDSGKTVSQVYKSILDGVSIPAQPPNPALEAQLATATAVLYRQVDVTDPDTGVVSKKTAETQLYRDYLDNQAAYNNARVIYIGAYLAAQETTTGKRTWPLVGPTMQLPVRQAYDRWRSAGADKVEQAIAILNTSTQNALQKAWDQGKKAYDGYGVTLDDSGTGTSPLVERSSLLPTDWYSSSSPGWTSLDTASGSVSTSSTSSYTAFGGSAGFSLGIFSIGGSAGHKSENRHMTAETNGLRFSLQYTLVSIRRPWLMFNLLGTKGWNLGNLYKKGAISNGVKDRQQGAVMPLLPLAFVAARNIVISANWSKTDLDIAKSSTTGGGSVGIGPFSIGGSYSHSSSKETFSSSFANGKITVPGVQIIGWISQVVPYCPPA